MKVRHIITTCGVILGGLAVAGSASAVVTYETTSDVQFTFAGTLSLTLSEDGFLIENLTPGNNDKSNEVTATVDTNNSAGYTLSAKVGNDSTYATTDLILDLSDTTNVFQVIGASDTALSAGKWGYTLNDGTTYGALARNTETVLNKTTYKNVTPASGYTGGSTTNMKIGAYAASAQAAGMYQNVVNFTVTPNVATHQVTVQAGTNVASVTPAAADSYGEGTVINISATCDSGYTFTNWNKPGDYGLIADPTSASTTYTVGAADATLTAYCTTPSGS